MSTRIRQIWYLVEVFRIKPLFKQVFDFQHTQRPRWLILGKYKLYAKLHQVDNSNNDVVIYWTMTGIHVEPDRQQYIGLRQVHTMYLIDNSMIGTHQLHLANADMIPGVVLDSQQYDRHTPITSRERRYDAWCTYSTFNRSFNEYSTTSRQPSIRADYSS